MNVKDQWYINCIARKYYVLIILINKDIFWHVKHK